MPDPKGRPLDEVRAVRDDIKFVLQNSFKAEGLEKGGSVIVRPATTDDYQASSSLLSLDYEF